jgi:uncharacterized protein
MEIKHEHNGNKGTFYVEQAGKRLAELDYTMANNNLMIINHTEVDEILKGKNTGNQLVNAAADFARSSHYKIFPLCPFANAVMKKRKAEFADVLRDN